MSFGEHLDRSFSSWKNPPWWFAVITLPWALGIVWEVHQFKVDRAIAHRQQTAVGIVGQHHPEDHNQYDYAFVVNGKSYTGRDSLRNRDLNTGEHLTVYYDPTDPNSSSFSDFSDLTTDALGPVPLELTGVAGVVAYIYSARRKTRRT